MRSTDEIVKDYKVVAEYKARGYSPVVALPANRLHDKLLVEDVRKIATDIQTQMDILYEYSKTHDLCYYIGANKIF